MSLINMLNWWQWMVMAAIPPLVIMLYFLKLRRTPVQVPSTYLWKRTIEDLHVNSIWQRLRQNLLLWLQLLILAAVILASLRPGLRTDQLIESRSILLIDNSASMQATDMGKNSRLSVAKQRALEMVDAMNRDDVAMVIAFNDRADVWQGYTSDRRRLRTAIESIPETNRVTDVTEALKAASGLANPGRTSQIQDVNDIQVAEALPARLYIFSDGGFAIPTIDLGNLTAEYIAVGASVVQNVAILDFSCERNPEKPDQIEAFARISNFSSQPTSGEVTLFLDDQLVDAASITIEPGEIQGVNFEIADVQEGRLKLQMQAQDHLKIDNVAYAAVTPSRQLEVVLATSGNPALAAALQTTQATSVANVRVISPDELATDEIQRLSTSGSVDLFIYDSCAPTVLPEANTLFLGFPPPSDQWKSAEASGPLFVIDVNRSHPLLQYVDLGTLLIAQGISFEIPNSATELVRTDSGILMAVSPRDSYQDAVVGLKLLQNNTNWINRRSFPVFILNCLEYLGGAVSSAGAKSIRPSQQAIVSIASRFDQVKVETPAGKQISVSRDGQPQFVFSQTDDLGVYTVRALDENRTLSMFNVNLFSEQESNIAPAAEVVIGLQTVEARSSLAQIVRTEYWRWLIGLALVILLVEWYTYYRRVAV